MTRLHQQSKKPSGTQHANAQQSNDQASSKFLSDLTSPASMFAAGSMETPDQKYMYWRLITCEEDDLEDLWPAAESNHYIAHRAVIELRALREELEKEKEEIKRLRQICSNVKAENQQVMVAMSNWLWEF
jgi:hypothetical protein